MKKGLIIGAIVAFVWLMLLTSFAIGQITWNHYIVDKVNQSVDAVNSIPAQYR